ncbi:Ubiquitin Carboxyl-Terminal Hydrolase 43 [Manis pentadactyla]|nr:Ubiquitin Carboxyl-Terminal Hydrolase 43 [Manis pentadactyla]
MRAFYAAPEEQEHGARSTRCDLGLRRSGVEEKGKTGDGLLQGQVAEQTVLWPLTLPSGGLGAWPSLDQRTCSSLQTSFPAYTQASVENTEWISSPFGTESKGTSEEAAGSAALRG